MAELKDIKGTVSKADELKKGYSRRKAIDNMILDVFKEYQLLVDMIDKDTSVFERKMLAESFKTKQQNLASAKSSSNWDLFGLVKGAIFGSDIKDLEREIEYAKAMSLNANDIYPIKIASFLSQWVTSNMQNQLAQKEFEQLLTNTPSSYEDNIISGNVAKAVRGKVSNETYQSSASGLDQIPQEAENATRSVQNYYSTLNSLRKNDINASIEGRALIQAEVEAQLELELQQAEERAQKIKEIELRITSETLEEKWELKLEAMEKQHEEELLYLEERNATEAEMDAARLAQKTEMEMAQKEASRAIYNAQISLAGQYAGAVKNIFFELYKVTGERHKGLFQIAKAAAVAEALVNTYLAASKAWAQGGIFGAVYAAIAIAGGMSNVAAIMSQGLATGGLVNGHSPNKRADNIPARLTAGEFVQQVDAVKYYGADVMQAINARAIPKELMLSMLTGVNIPAMRSNRGHYALGGLVGGMDMGNLAPQRQNMELTIVNVPDANLMDDYLSTTNGQARLINVISQNATQVRQALEVD